MASSSAQSVVADSADHVPHGPRAALGQTADFPAARSTSGLQRRTAATARSRRPGGARSASGSFRGHRGAAAAIPVRAPNDGLVWTGSGQVLEPGFGFNAERHDRSGQELRRHISRHDASRRAEIRRTDCSETSRTDQSLPATSMSASRAMCSTCRRSAGLISTDASTKTQSN